VWRHVSTHTAIIFEPRFKVHQVTVPTFLGSQECRHTYDSKLVVFWLYFILNINVKHIGIVPVKEKLKVDFRAQYKDIFVLYGFVGLLVSLVIYSVCCFKILLNYSKCILNYFRIDHKRFFLCLFQTRCHINVTVVPCCCILILSEFFYLPTDAQESCFKKNIKIYIKTAPTYFGLITIIRERIIGVLLKLLLLK
jgi:hypothetical protein